MLPNGINDSKVSKFLEAINAYAEHQLQKIRQELEQFKAERLRQAEDEVLTDAYRLIHEEQDHVRKALQQEMAARDFQERKALLTRRREMMDEVFAKASEKLLAFTGTPDYEDYLKRSLARMMEQLPPQGNVYFLCPRDEKYIPALSALCPADTRFEIQPQIVLGGLRARNEEANLELDDTLDSRLEQQRDWFIQQAGLALL